MKILEFTDNHCCEVSSILRKFGTKYSVRLENQIQCLNWVEEMAAKYNCQAVICGGDFFNTASLSDSEITAAKEIQWNNYITHYFIVGNHESGSSDLQYSSTKLLEAQNRFVISKPCSCQADNTEICFLPYIVESDRQPIENYFGPKQSKRIIFSHNDIKGIQMGPAISSTGFTVDEIEANCDLFINGHLHNGTKITNKILNLGNLTGQNFGEDALIYKHNIAIIDTETLQYEFIENPYALNFYKLEVKSDSDMRYFNKLKNNAVVSVKCADNLVKAVQAKINELTEAGTILESRVTIIKEVVSEAGEIKIEELSVDHLAKLYEFCKEKLGDTDIVNTELSVICR